MSAFFFVFFVSPSADKLPIVDTLDRVSILFFDLPFYCKADWGKKIKKYNILTKTEQSSSRDTSYDVLKLGKGTSCQFFLVDKYEYICTI